MRECRSGVKSGTSEKDREGGRTGLCSGDPDTWCGEESDCSEQGNRKRDACGAERTAEADQGGSYVECRKQINHRGGREHEIKARPKPCREDIEREAGGVGDAHNEADVLKFGSIAGGRAASGANMESGGIHSKSEQHEADIPAPGGAGHGM